jgi:hypothetical protein
VERLRVQLHKAEAWLADKGEESRQLRLERDAAMLELAALRKQQQGRRESSGH